MEEGLRKGMKKESSGFFVTHKNKDKIKGVI